MRRKAAVKDESYCSPQLFRVEGRRLGLFPPRGKIEMGALALPKSKAAHVSSSLNSYLSPNPPPKVDGEG